MEGGRAKSVTIRNVPAYLHLRDATVRVPGMGDVVLDVAWGGNFYALLPAASVGLAVRPALHDELVRTGLAVMGAVNEQLSFAHPEQPSIDTCHHVVFTEPGDESVSGRAAVAIHPGWLDRSPCGTGTSARMAQLYARGELGLDQEYVHASVLGTTFAGRLLDTTVVGGFDAVVPIGPRARLGHRAGQLHAGPGRPLPGRVPAGTRQLKHVCPAGPSPGLMASYRRRRRSSWSGPASSGRPSPPGWRRPG